jgi:hypothetical protein
MRLSRKRLLVAAGTLTALGAATTLVAGVTFGLFSAGVAQTPANTFTAGTVTLTQTASTSCTIAAMEPGDASTGWTTPGTDTPCTFQVTYTGTLGAFIGLGVVATPAIGGLYNGTSTGLQFLLTDGAGTSYTTGGVIHTNTATPLDPLFTNDDAAGTTTHTFTVNYQLPLSATNSQQGLSTTLTLTAYAVQDSNNGSSATCTKGQECSTITAWS